MTNSRLVKKIYEQFRAYHVDEVIVCAGARNAPLVIGLDPHFQVKSYFEERSAAFYALGRVEATKKPVVVVTTSGTAVAELFPAVIESCYLNLPLIVLTADRPKKYRGSGAPQAIIQNDIFKNYCQFNFDVDVFSNFDEVVAQLRNWNQKSPLHLNVCFDEPLIDDHLKDQELAELPDSIDSMKSDLTQWPDLNNPLVILSQIPQSDRPAVLKWLKNNNIPHYAEVLSGLQNHEQLRHLQLPHLDMIFVKLFEQKIFSTVIRIGGVPTLRLWRDLENHLRSVPVVNLSHRPWSGLARPSFQLDYSDLPRIEKKCFFNDDVVQKVISLNSQAGIEKQKLFQKWPAAEATLFKDLSLSLLNQSGHGYPVYIGNSLPIREWDQFAEGHYPDVMANRGANGIDGQVSTYLGWAQDFDRSYCVIGDLTAQYDLAALGLVASALDQQAISKVFHIIVINNFGGQIFKKVFNHHQFLNPHEINFSGWAQIWGWNYRCVRLNESLKSAPWDKTIFQNNKNTIIEIQVESSQSDQFNAEWFRLVETQFKQYFPVNQQVR